MLGVVILSIPLRIRVWEETLLFEGGKILLFQFLCGFEATPYTAHPGQTDPRFQFLCGFERVGHYGAMTAVGRSGLSIPLRIRATYHNVNRVKQRLSDFQFLCGFEFFNDDGEVVGSEVFQFLCGFETGQPGHPFTLHAELLFQFLCGFELRVAFHEARTTRSFQFLCGFETFMISWEIM